MAADFDNTNDPSFGTARDSVNIEILFVIKVYIILGEWTLEIGRETSHPSHCV